MTDVPSRHSSQFTSIDSTATYDLSSLGPVGATSGIIFRIYASASIAEDGAIIQRYDNFQVSGDVAVIPEPATWALLAISLATAMVMRRRRNS